MFLNKDLQRKMFCVCFISFAAFVLTGCGGGGGGGGSSSGVGGAVISSDSGLGSGTTDLGPLTLTSLTVEDTGSLDTGSTVVKVHNPEPSSMLLLGSGLLGMLIAKRKKGKK